MSTESSRAAIEDIQRQMAQIRLALHQDVDGAVKGARSMTDWRAVVASHPWAALAAAAALGYLVVPKRQPAEVSGGQLAGAPTPIIAESETPDRQVGTRRGRWAVLSTAFSLLAPVVVRAGQNYLLEYVQRWLAQYPPFSEDGMPLEARSGKPAATSVILGPSGLPASAADRTPA
jgi:hypothetical protein